MLYIPGISDAKLSDDSAADETRMCFSDPSSCWMIIEVSFKAGIESGGVTIRLDFGISVGSKFWKDEKMPALGSYNKSIDKHYCSPYY